MLDLSNITILTVNCTNPLMGAYALKYSCKDIKFKEALLFTHEDIRINGINTISIPKLNSVDEYNDFILRLADYIKSDYALIIQDDGFILNANMWDDRFLKYDFIGAVWPNEESWIERQKAKSIIREIYPRNRVGNGGFSLRSWRFMELSSEWKTCIGFGEDCFLNTINYNYMVASGINYPPIELANKFSMENNLDKWDDIMYLDPSKHFGFHGHNFTNSNDLINLKKCVY